MVTISAIIPTFNRSKLFEECLNSILHQSRSPDQIIVVNDGSTDNTAQVASKYLDKIEYIQKENSGKAASLNQALQLVNSDYIWICDDDDIAPLDALEKLAGALETDHPADYVVGKFKKFKVNENGEKIFSSPSFNRRPEEPNLKINFMEDMFVFQFAMLISKETYDKTGFFCEDLIRSQDYEMMTRIARESRGLMIDDVIFYQREHSGVRGSANALINYDDVEEKWMRADQSFFKTILDIYDLEEFEPSFVKHSDSTTKERASIVQKTAIAAKKGLWEEAAAELKKTVKYDPESVTVQEKRICSRVLHNPLSWKFLYNDKASLSALKKLYKSSQTTKILIFSLFQSIRWMVRNSLKNKDIKRSFQLCYIAYHVLGIKDSYALFSKRRM